MSDFKVVKYSDIYHEVWDIFMAKAKNGTFLFNRDFMEYHQDRFQDASVLVFKNEILIAVFPANQVKKKIFNHQGLTYGGLVYTSKIKFLTVLDIFKSVLQFYESQAFDTLELKLQPSIYSAVPNGEMDYLMFLLDAQLIRRDMLAVVKISDEILFSKNRKEGVKRGIKNKLVVKNDNLFDDFWNSILIPNLKNRHQTDPVHSLNEIKQLHKLFPDNIKQFNVYKNEKLVAGTTIFVTNQVAHSQYISGDSDKNKLGSLDFLHDYLLKTVFINKPYFDFGISNESQGKQVNSGLQYWKEGFGARAITQDFYSLPISNYKKLTNVMI
ncbi:GNAT family N-acetyltransferase [Bizionia argentinensis JUB59]|uniref:GNAT family N-acetyltransferase n=1 Tax=Bizionia argentinensis JUB59 TaxID=1046627 RepID=G2EG78_9FLAO|nr:hypothetical protein [Bizionia argentinensis]EGV42561.2 GNAT family N-acetyltransferase [Bizionia argentinensis JUB59]